MIEKPYELLVRFNDNGTVRGASIQTIVNINGKDFPQDPKPLSGATDPAFVAFAEQFIASVITERDSLLVEKTALESATSDLTTQTNLLSEQFATLTEQQSALQTEKNQLDSQVAELQSLVDSKNSIIDSYELQVASLQAELDAFKNPPVNPRHFAPYDFFNLFTNQEQYLLETSPDPVVVVGRAKLHSIISYIDLDNEQTIQLVQYLELQGMIDKGRANQILAGESYV